MNNTVTEMKNTLEKYNSRATKAEEWISELEDRVVDITAIKQNKGKRIKRNEDSLRDIQDNIKQTKNHIIEVPEEKKRKRKGLRKYLKIL